MCHHRLSSPPIVEANSTFKGGCDLTTTSKAQRKSKNICNSESLFWIIRDDTKNAHKYF